MTAPIVGLPSKCSLEFFSAISEIYNIIVFLLWEHKGQTTLFSQYIYSLGVYGADFVEISLTVHRANRLLYSGFADLVVQGSGKAVRDMSMPTVSASKDGIIDEVEKMPELPAEDIMTSANDSHDETISVESKQITPNLITLSMLPKPQWQGLINLDTIKVVLVSFFIFYFATSCCCCSRVFLWHECSQSVPSCCELLHFVGCHIELCIGCY